MDFERKNVPSLRVRSVGAKSIDSFGGFGDFYTIFPHCLQSSKSIDSFGENGDFLKKLQNLHFSYLFWGL